MAKAKQRRGKAPARKRGARGSKGDDQSAKERVAAAMGLPSTYEKAPTFGYRGVKPGSRAERKLSKATGTPVSKIAPRNRGYVPPRKNRPPRRAR